MEQRLQERISRLPESPGVYLMRDGGGALLYVGKAVNLRRRVASYFSRTPESAKTALLVSRIRDIEVIAAATGREALLLEANLIKKHHPPFNIQLRDSKKYPYLAVTLGEDFPRLIKTRSREVPGTRYFGPFPGVDTIRRTIEVLHRLFPIRYCSRKLVAGRKNGSACIYHHLGRCGAPCEGRVDREAYAHGVQGALLFLEGRSDELLEGMRTAMRAHAADQAYEAAAALRDRIRALEGTLERQAIQRADELDGPGDFDVLHYHEDAGLAAFAVLGVRGGKLEQQELFLERDADRKPGLFLQFIKQRLADGPPPLLLVPETPGLAEEIPPDTVPETRLLTENDPECSLVLKKLLFQAAANARLALEEALSGHLAASALDELAAALALPGPPRRIEGFDIATTGGEETVAGMVVFQEGRALRREHRRYRIKSFSGQDDYAALREAVARRYMRLQNEGQAMPDLILIDGGPGQLAAAREPLVALGLETLPILSLAKREELVYLPDRSEPLALPRHRLALRLLQAVRDEAHRNVNRFHRERRDKKRATSLLELVPGIGPQTRRKLLTRFGSIAGIRQAAPAEVEGLVGKQTAAALLCFLNREG